MTTRTISITGVDGTGKTSVVYELRDRFLEKPNHLQAFNAPQYHQNTNAPFRNLSYTLEQLSQLADELKDPQLKATALFLSVTLFGDVQSFFLNTYQPKFLVTERQPILDSLSYAAFYRRLLTGPIDQSKRDNEIIEKVGIARFQQLKIWIKVLFGRLPDSEQRPDFWSMPLFIRSLLEQEDTKLIEDLSRLYHVRLPDLILILTVDQPVLETRLLEKAKKSGVTEMHEQKSSLELLQKSLLSGCQILQKHFPELRVQTINSTNLSLEETADKVMELIEA